ncbi:MAG: hypothetical protein HDR05_08005 [Lachnospiraceae bacterium]|nr:hypothetical protein [Lachnospiraceae bacterium]
MRAINMMISKYNFRKGDAARIRYIVIHYTGGFGTAEKQCQYLAGGDRHRSAHYFVGYEGEIWQSVEDENIAWHCGAKRYEHSECRNANSIGIELCVRKKDQSHISAGDGDWYFEDATVEAAVELTRYLMMKYNVPAANVLRHYDVTGKVCPAPYVHNTTQHTWEEFKKAVSRREDIDWIGQIKRLLSEICRVLGEILKGKKTENDDDDRHMTHIMGKPQVSADQIAAYMIRVNPAAAPYAKQLADTFIEEGRQEGVRGDIAAAQAMLETGNLTFAGSAVTLDQNNFCGMGVTSNGMKGCSFQTMREGVRAQIQHLKAYASEKELKNGCVDPRYAFVQKGCAPYVEWLGQKENPQGRGWASGQGYGDKICRILDEMKKQRG